MKLISRFLGLHIRLEPSSSSRMGIPMFMMSFIKECFEETYVDETKINATIRWAEEKEKMAHQHLPNTFPEIPLMNLSGKY